VRTPMWLQRAIRLLLPQEVRFFDYVEAAARAADTAATLMDELAAAPSREYRMVLVERIRDAEHDGDRAMKDMSDALDQTFVTPIDREDLYHLTSAIETVSDFIAATANQLTVHQMETLPHGSREMVSVLVRCTSQFRAAVRRLRSNGGSESIRLACSELRRLEHEADVIFRMRLGDLFAREKDAIQLIKDKEFLEGLEDAVDRCASVGKVLEAIVIKNA
jgi:uncharacterized protein